MRRWSGNKFRSRVVYNVKNSTCRKDSGLEGRRTSRTGTIITVLALGITVCSFLFGLVQRVLKVWPQSGCIHYVLVWSIFLVPLSCALVILGDIVEFLLSDLNRCNVDEINFSRYDAISDKNYSKLIYDFKISVGIVLVILVAYVIVNTVMQKNLLGIVIIVFFILWMISLKDNIKRMIPVRLIQIVLKRLGTFGLAIFVVFTVSIGIVANTEGQFICTFSENGVVELQNAIEDYFDDARIIIRDTSDENIVNMDISEDELLFANEMLKSDLMDNKGNVMGTAHQLSGEMLYWKYRVNMNTFSLPEGKYTLVIELHQGSSHVTISNMFVLEKGTYYFGKDKMEKNY